MLNGSAQNTLKMFQWSDHLPYNLAFSVTSSGHTIYAAANECVYSYDIDTKTYERLNKVTGLSDVEPIIVRNNPYNNTLMIVYANSNIDIIQNNTITNIPDIYLKQNIGNKTISSVTFINNIAYISCGFGIAVFDTQSLQFNDTYIIGPNGGSEFVYQVAVSHTEILAATNNGIFKAALNASNLSSYTNWSLVTGLPSGPYNGIVFFGGNIITNFSKYIKSGNTIDGEDTMYTYNGTAWSKNPYNTIDGIRSMRLSENGKQLMIIDRYGFQAFDSSGLNLERYWGDFLYTGSWIYTADATADPVLSGYYWAADQVYGLYQVKTPSDPKNMVQINGPILHSAKVSSGLMTILNNKLLAAPTYLGEGEFNNYSKDNVLIYQNGTWKDATANETTVNFDINCVAFDRNDNTHYYGGSWWDGLIEYKNDVEIHRYNYSNTGNMLHSTDYSNSTITRVGGLCTDLNNNLWIAMGETQNLISVRKTDGTFTALDFTPVNLLNGNGTINPLYPRLSQIIVDTNNYVWGVSYGAGLYVYNNSDGKFNPPNNSNAKILTNIINQGGLPSVQILSVAEDKNHDIWVGTDKGVYVFYNPQSIFSQPNGWDAQPIYIQQNGLTQLLLQTDEVTAIAVDGGNNKWFGTHYSGLYCFTPDGQTQLFHFTTDNSPIFSNSVIGITVNPITGEIFISTDKGILSFQNTVTEGFVNFTDVYAYPNPVKPDYTGPIMLHGMVNGSQVKIVDAAGNFVFETTVEGGQAVWNGKTFDGKRVASGVYLAICAATDGSQKALTKIMVLN